MLTSENYFSDSYFPWLTHWKLCNCLMADCVGLMYWCWSLVCQESLLSHSDPSLIIQSQQMQGPGWSVHISHMIDNDLFFSSSEFRRVMTWSQRQSDGSDDCDQVTRQTSSVMWAWRGRGRGWWACLPPLLAAVRVSSSGYLDHDFRHVSESSI